MLVGRAVYTIVGLFLDQKFPFARGNFSVGKSCCLLLFIFIMPKPKSNTTGAGKSTTSNEPRLATGENFPTTDDDDG